MAFGEIAGPPLRASRRAARAVRGRRDGRGVHRRGPRSADLGGQRGGDDRRLHPHPAGHARRRHRHRDLPRAQLRHHLHHQAAAPRPGHRPRRPMARLRRPQGRRRHAPVPGPAGRPGNRDTRRSMALRPDARAGPAGPADLPQATRRLSTRASPWPRHCASSRPTAATACRCYPATAGRCRAGSPTHSVLQAVAAEIGSLTPARARPAAAGRHRPGRGTDPLRGYQVLEITLAQARPPRAAARQHELAARQHPRLHPARTAACENPTRASPWPPVTASACSHHCRPGHPRRHRGGRRTEAPDRRGRSTRRAGPQVRSRGALARSTRVCGISAMMRNGGSSCRECWHAPCPG